MSSSAETAAKSGEGLRVLVIDDEAFHAQTVAESLERVGYECLVVTSGKEKLLTHILDPNREVAPQFAAYIAELTDGSTLAGTQSPLRCEAQEYFQFGWIIDTLLGDLGRIQGGGISRLLFRIGVGDLYGDVIGGDE